MYINNSLIALACGDSYGAIYENSGLCGQKFSINKLPNKPLDNSITDDTRMAMILWKHYINYKKIDIKKLTIDYKYWAKLYGDIDGIGLHTKAVLVNNQLSKDSQGNGALMRVIPFGVKLIDDGYSFEEAIRLMNIDSTITHENSTVFICNKLCLDLAINGLAVIHKEEYKNILSKLHYGTTAWVLHSVYIVIEALKQNLNFLDGFKYIVSKGGDTDTNCAIYGAIKGCENNIRDEVDIDAYLPSSLIQKIKD